MKRTALSFRLVFFLLVLGGGVTVARPAAADDRVVGDGSPGSCNEISLNGALTLVQNSGGGRITFNCGGPAEIFITSYKVIYDDVVLEGAGEITLNGNFQTHFFLVDAGASLTLNDIVLTSGYNLFDGGAIVNGGTLVLNRSTIKDSGTSNFGSGGAIDSYGPVTINDSTLQGNSAANGGALMLRFAGGSAEINDSRLLDNQAVSPTDGWGGAILLWGDADVTITGGEISGNSARAGGGISTRFPGADIFLYDGVTLTDNVAAGEGGAIDLTEGWIHAYEATFSDNQANIGGAIATFGANAQAYLYDITFSSNSALFAGGAIDNDSYMVIDGATFTGNTAQEAGAIRVDEGDTTLINTTFSGNSADKGAGLYNEGGKLVVTSSTFYDNRAQNDNGDSILHYGLTEEQVTNLQSVILAKSTQPGGRNCLVEAGSATEIFSAGFNLADDDSCALNMSSDYPNTDPLLEPLADNGGPTLTHMLMSTSPAINHGACTTPYDQRGVPRPYGVNCDIGSVEYTPFGGLRMVIPMVLK